MIHLRVIPHLCSQYDRAPREHKNTRISTLYYLNPSRNTHTRVVPLIGFHRPAATVPLLSPFIALYLTILHSLLPGVRRARNERERERGRRICGLYCISTARINDESNEGFGDNGVRGGGRDNPRRRRGKKRGVGRGKKKEKEAG